MTVRFSGTTVPLLSSEGVLLRLTLYCYSSKPLPFRVAITEHIRYVVQMRTIPQFSGILSNTALLVVPFHCFQLRKNVVVHRKRGPGSNAECSDKKNCLDGLCWRDLTSSMEGLALPGETEGDKDASVLRQVLLQMDRVEQSLRANLEAHNGTMEESLQQVSRRLDSFAAELQQLTSSTSTVALRSNRSTDYCAPRGRFRKREAPTETDLPNFAEVVNVDNVGVYVLRAFATFAVYAFGVHYESLSQWTSPLAESGLHSIRRIIPRVSGLSLPFFSVYPLNPNKKYCTELGRVWTWMCASAILLLLHGRGREAFEKNGRPVPAWMQRFGKGESPVGDVVRIIRGLQESNEGQEKRSSKRSRSSVIVTNRTET
eukprot:IDg4096t1